MGYVSLTKGLKMEKVAQNLHAVFSVRQPIDFIDYFSQATTEWE